MKSRIEVYLTDDEINHLKREAARRQISISRYAKERLAPAGQDEKANDPAERLAATVRKMLAERADGLAENLRTVVVMLDQLVRLSTPDEQHYRAWQRTVEEMLRRPAPHANGNGARA